ncbi:MAG: hypothetical protein HEP71_16325 [Roseivirga sp.]|nr:hypothetical protein [Roseivirga sp.]
MTLNNTITLSSTDASQAEQDFKSLIAEKDVITVIVFGNTAVSQQAIQSADVRAGSAPAGFKRKAVWMQDTSQWDTLKKYLKNGTIAVSSVNPGNLIAIGVSLSDKIDAEVPTSKTPDFIVMELAFVQASQE